MKTGSRSKTVVMVLLIFAALLGWGIATAPEHPVALIVVQDKTGKPIEGATIRPDGMRTKAGPYQGGHYGWPRDKAGLSNLVLRTDRAGKAVVPYPKYVFERIETGQISFLVTHPEYVSDRPFRFVEYKPPAGAPLKEWASFLADRVKHRVLVARPEPVVLERGGILRIAALNPGEGELFAQISNVYPPDESTPHGGKDVVVCGNIPSGPQAVRLARISTNGMAWFSDVVSFAAVAEKTNELRLELRPGVTIRGRLDEAVPRPVPRGRVIAHVTPAGISLQNSPPDWHAWSEVAADGTFAFVGMPPGDLEISALCDGFISTNGPGQHALRYPQKHLIGSNDLEIVIGMEPMARVEVKVLDSNGKPLKDASVAAWPNIRYGEWSAVIFGSDCYNTAEGLLRRKPAWTLSREHGLRFVSVSDANGNATLWLPKETQSFAVRHPEFQMPVVDDGNGQKSCQGTLQLAIGKTNQVFVRLEPLGSSAIAHY